MVAPASDRLCHQAAPHRFRKNTRWWPPFCLTVDWVAAAIVAIAITAGVDFG
jgi:hypothetical protein